MNNKSSFNAGKLIDCDGYQAYCPNKINQPFTIKDNKTLVLLEQASATLSRLNFLCHKIGQSNMYIDMLVIFEAIRSNEIEGTKTSLDEVLSIDSETKNKDIEFWNLFHLTMKYFNAEKEITIDISNISTIEKINKELFNGTKNKEKHIGKIRTNQNYIGGNSELTALYVPPPCEMVQELLEDLSEFWLNKNLYLPNLIKIAIYHYQFETIHPFNDGNGRTGRILINLQLKKSKLLDFPVLCLSDYWSKNKGYYYDALTTVRYSHNIEHWIRFFLDSIINTSEERIKTIENIEKIRTKYMEEFKNFTRLPQHYEKLFDQLLKRPLITITRAKELLGMSYQGANKIIQKFIELGILKETNTNKRNKEFVFREYYDLVFKSIINDQNI